MQLPSASAVSTRVSALLSEEFSPRLVVGDGHVSSDFLSEPRRPLALHACDAAESADAKAECEVRAACFALGLSENAAAAVTPLLQPQRLCKCRPAAC